MQGQSQEAVDDEVSRARLEAMLEGDDTHKITFSGLSNADVMTLSAALASGREAFEAAGEDTRAKQVKRCEYEVQKSADELFSVLGNLQ